MLQERPANLPVKNWDITRLRSHPLQKVYFRWRSKPEMDALVEDMRLNGQLEPIEVLPCGTIISGHHRWRVARRLGWATVKVVVRNDLAELGDAACEARLLEANRTHRRLKPLEKARMFERLRELGRGDHSEQLAEELDLSVRQLRRLCRLLRAPIEVQKAVDDKRLTQKAAERVADAGPQQQQQVAELIRQGRPAQFAVTKVLGFPTRDKPSRLKIQRLWRDFLARGRDLRDLGPEALAGLMPAHGAKLGQVVEWMLRLALLAAAQQLATLKGPIAITIVPEDAA